MMILYAIRHVKSKIFMPLMRKGRGYSHWNPDKNPTPTAALPIIRFFVSEKAAKLAARSWFNFPNARISGHQTHSGDWDEDLSWKDDGRSLDDLEVVQLQITEVR